MFPECCRHMVSAFGQLGMLRDMLELWDMPAGTMSPGEGHRPGGTSLLAGTVGAGDMGCCCLPMLISSLLS